MEKYEIGVNFFKVNECLPLDGRNCHCRWSVPYNQVITTFTTEFYLFIQEESSSLYSIQAIRNDKCSKIKNYKNPFLDIQTITSTRPNRICKSDNLYTKADCMF